MTGYLRQDDDSHWYFISHWEISDFDEHMKDMHGLEYMDAPEVFDTFIQLYDKYRIDDPCSLRFSLEEPKS